MPKTEISGYFEAAGRQVYGTLFRPETPTGGGVVLYDPFGEEKKCAFRLMVRLARAASAAGLTVLRFDLSGTGESPGSHAEATWEQWQREAGAAMKLLRDEPGVTHCTAVGVRLGALLAARVAATGLADSLSLVEPILGGDECLRDLERRRKIKIMMGGGVEEKEPESLWQQGRPVDFGGIEVGAALAAELGEESLTQALRESGADLPLQVVRVSGGKSFPAAWEELCGRAERVAPGRAELVRDKPFWGQLEYYESPHVIDTVMGFLRDIHHLPSEKAVIEENAAS